MAAKILLLNTKVEIQKTLDAAKTLTGITKASPAVVTSTAHGYANGDIVVLAVAGMIELDGRACRVAAVSANTFELEGVDSSAYTTFTSGTAQKISAWDSFGNVTQFSIPEPSPSRIDATTIHDVAKQELFGLDEAVQASMILQADPLDVAVVNLRAASLAKATRGFRVTLQNGYKLVFNAYVAGGRGFDGQQGAVATAQANFTFRNTESWFAS